MLREQSRQGADMMWPPCLLLIGLGLLDHECTYSPAFTGLMICPRQRESLPISHTSRVAPLTP